MCDGCVGIVLGFDTKDGWSVVVGGLEEGFACPSPTRGLRTVVYGFRFPMVCAGLEGGWWMVGEMVVQCLNCPKVGRMSVRGRRKGALLCATRAIKAYAHEPTALHDLRRF